ncbi:heavy metal translocating P-type ATPase [Flavisolibacter ginsenosidimutans]|uniref:Cadmium-translocating P-type ATPase n=1 Tax=Flavisolibacter ginsenosidimutans TaxID=661481 RepID=A0A5B8ULH5_9BACT|nr:cation-translocating P-type ATPase [Flavisolibacter ginsenosidimutans]QEC57029.1 cadmium-translocating P-type ATPase [Flavisolibacter ginsenosidimutans]
MEKIAWKVEGMHCANCALSINKYLQNKGAKNVSVNAIDGDVSFEVVEKEAPQQLAQGIEQMGYKIRREEGGKAIEKKPFLANHLQRFLFCLPFTSVLMLHMIPGLHIHFLMNPWVQLALTFPVFVVGMNFFGRSAVKSLRNGIPNMNVLITVGALAAFVYSLTGAIMGLGDNYLFFETAATIITLVFFGEYLEHASIQSTQRSLKALAKSQKVMANMIAFDGDHQEHIFPIENTQLKVGDLVQINTGEQVPADCKILWGEAELNEALLTGESAAIHKKAKDFIIGGSVVESGTLKAQVTAVGGDTVLSGIINLVKKAQGEKPPVQQMADKISAVFVPTVITLALIALAVNWVVLKDFTPALLRSIAVLVIACPCAMGLATPAAIAVGLGRGARNGILFRNAKSLELFKDAKQVVFDKTGTLTTGKFAISNWSLTNGIAEDEFKRIVYSLEKYSSHPLAKSITAQWKTGSEIRWKKIDEIKGLGLHATDMQGDQYAVGSIKILEGIVAEKNPNVYVTKNGELLGWIDLQDELRPEAKPVVQFLHSHGAKTILLSGDTYAKSKQIADSLGIEEVIAEQTPEQKLQKIAALSKEATTVMVGDGINDAPALAKATIGISMSEASQLAMQSAQVVLMGGDLKKLPTALGLGKHTYLTIKQNLFWAFAYNIVAIPVAAFGLLNPTFAALVMGVSDVVLAINSVRLYVKKVV